MTGTKVNSDTAAAVTASRLFRDAIAARAHKNEPQTCGRSLPRVGGAENNQPQETTPTRRPRVNGAATPTRGLADRTGDDRLMSKITGSEDPPPPACPNCGELALRLVERAHDNHIRVGYYGCANRHIWETKWLVGI